MKHSKLVQLAYLSTAAPDLSEKDVKEIIAAASRNNSEIGVTGLLIWRHNQFFQLLEGPETAIDVLMRHIRQDKRHSNLMVLSRKAIEKRNFGKWYMGYAGAEKELGSRYQTLEAVMAEPNADGLDENDPMSDLIESFRRGLWDVE